MSVRTITKFLLALICVISLSFATTGNSAFAGEINTDGNGVAIQGYDPVAYFAQSAAVKGSNSFRGEHDGAVYLFSSAENLATFEADPAKYVPQYGGYCAYGLAGGYKAPVQPEAFTVSEGKLYLNYNQSVREQWLRDIPGYVEKADGNWREIGG